MFTLVHPCPISDLYGWCCRRDLQSCRHTLILVELTKKNWWNGILVLFNFVGVCIGGGKGLELKEYCVL